MVVTTKDLPIAQVGIAAGNVDTIAVLESLAALPAQNADRRWDSLDNPSDGGVGDLEATFGAAVLAVESLIALGSRLEGSGPALRAAFLDLPPDLGDAGALASRVEASDGVAEVFVYFEAAISGGVFCPALWTRDWSFESCPGLGMCAALRRDIGQSIEPIAAPEGTDADSGPFGQFICRRAGDNGRRWLARSWG